MLPSQRPSRRSTFIAGLIATSLVAFVGPAAAVQWSWGEANFNFDSTFTFGVQLRTESPSSKNYCTTIGGPNALTTDPNDIVPTGAGDGPGANGDCGKSEGNLNYEQWKPTSTILKGIHEFDASYGNYSTFVRFQWWYDGINQFGERARTPLTDQAKFQMGAGAQLLDAYIQGNWYPGDIPVSFKFGNVVLNWGESTFLQNGLNAINPIDVRRLRVPGAELRDALLPVPLAWASVSPMEWLTVEGFYQFWWHNTIIDPPGTFFSTHDALGPGGRWFDVARGWNDCDTANPDTLGYYFGPTQGAGPTALGGNFFNCIKRGPNDGARNHGQYGFATRFFLPGAAGTELGLFFMNVHSRLPYTGGTAYLTLADTGGDFGEIARNSFANQFYPEDVKKVGASFSTGWDKASLAFQGEFAYSIDQPLQISEIQLLAALFSATGLPVTPAPGTPQATIGEFYEGIIKKDVVTVQATMTYVGEPGRVIGDWLKASQFLFITEFGYMRIVDFVGDPTNSRYVPLQAQVTPQEVESPTNPLGNSATQNSAFATQNSLGYVIRAALPYNNLFLGVNVRPFIGWSHGVWGHSPAPLLNYSQDSMSVNLGVTFEYQNQWSSSIGYTNFFGGGVNNPRNDRDFLSFDIKYAF